jgi:hypothetical protein
MTETIETTAPAEPEPTPRKRKPSLKLVISPLIAIAVVAGIALVGGNSYQNQLSTVQAMEGAIGNPAADASFDARADVQAFKKDPVFQSPAWAAFHAESQTLTTAVKARTATAMQNMSEKVWWPGLADRAHEAERNMQEDTARWDRLEFLAAAAPVMQSCEDKTRAIEQRIDAWDADEAKNPSTAPAAYVAAQQAVMPDIFRAGVQYFCR